jgi:hypothetical protein
VKEGLLRRLGSFERAMVRTQRHSPFNVVVWLRFASGPDLAAVARGLAALSARHPLLAARLGRDGGAQAFFASGRPVPVEVGEPCSGDAWPLLVERALEHPFDLDRGPLCHAFLCDPDEGGGRDLVLTFPHAIVDADSGASLVRELLALLAAHAAATGEGIAGPAEAAVEPANLPPVVERFPATHQGFARRLRVLRALGREAATELRFRRLARGLPPLPPAPAGSSRASGWELPAAETSALLAGLRRRRLTLNAALVAAWSAAFAAARYGGRPGPVRTFTMAGLRRLVKPPLGETALGSGWAMFRLLLDVPGKTTGDGAEPDLAPLAARVRDDIHGVLARGEAFDAYLTPEPMMALALGPVKQRMGEIAVSYGGVVDLPETVGPWRLTGLQAFVSTMDVAPALIVQLRIWRGRLAAGVVHHGHDLDAAAVAAIGDDVKRRLLALAAAPPPEPPPSALPEETP